MYCIENFFTTIQKIILGLMLFNFSWAEPASNVLNNIIAEKSIEVTKSATKLIVHAPKTSLDRLAKNFAIVVFYRSTCSHCLNFVPLIYTYTKQNNFDLYLYALDQKPLQGFPYLFTTQTVTDLFFNAHENLVVPTTFLVNKIDKDEHVLFAQGEMQKNELTARMNDFANRLGENRV